jgi:cytochrome P450
VICLDDNPDAFAELRARPELVPQALEEVLRYRPSATFAFRETRRDVELGGREIPRGTLVLPVVASANRDPAVFADPETFDIHRDPNPHIAFGPWRPTSAWARRSPGSRAASPCRRSSNSRRTSPSPRPNPGALAARSWSTARGPCASAPGRALASA